MVDCMQHDVVVPGARPLLALMGDASPAVRAAVAADLGATLALVAPPAGGAGPEWGSAAGLGSGFGHDGGSAEWLAALVALEAGAGRDWRLHLAVVRALPLVLQACVLRVPRCLAIACAGEILVCVLLTQCRH